MNSAFRHCVLQSLISKSRKVLWSRGCRKHLGKREMKRERERERERERDAGHQQFLLVSECFQMLTYLRDVKHGIGHGKKHCFPNKPWLLRVCRTSLFKTLWEKGEIARNEQILLFPQRFLTVWIIFCQFSQI